MDGRVGVLATLGALAIAGRLRAGSRGVVRSGPGERAQAELDFETCDLCGEEWLKGELKVDPHDLGSHICPDGRCDEAGSRGVVRSGAPDASKQPPEIVVLEVRPHKVGFSGAGVTRAMSRGKTFDPNEIDRVEVTIGSDDASALHRAHEVLELARKAAILALGGRLGWGRIVSGVFVRQRQPRFGIRIEVS